jgi:hypothetical protein
MVSPGEANILRRAETPEAVLQILAEAIPAAMPDE